MPNPWRYVVAGWELLRLLVATRFRLHGDYLRWRRETAFGNDPERMPPSRARRHAIVDYANWVASMRRLRRR